MSRKIDVLVIVNELQRTIFTLDPLEKKLGSAPSSPTVQSSFEEGSGPGCNDQAFELQLSKASSFNFRPSCTRSGQIPVPPDELKWQISLQLMYDPVIISFATSTLKILVEQSKYDPFSSQSQVGEIFSQFEKKGFKLTGLKLFQCPKELAEEHYKDLTVKPFFPKLIDYITSGPVVCMIEKLRLEHIKLVEESNELHLEKKKLAEKASYAKVSSNEAIETANLIALKKGLLVAIYLMVMLLLQLKSQRGQKNESKLIVFFTCSIYLSFLDVFKITSRLVFLELLDKASPGSVN
ncbi:hypothetical protein Syun_018851 [Stephania yunnanensis]|uniref:nucleoside-diphosphate kinase n=1 Tax=Stephania yunnanensis TaxID=152371 RepID=A0AAP0IT60_9MAGN